MANARLVRRSGPLGLCVEGLEARGLLSGGLGPPSVVIRELGAVSPAAALAGVEATAAIAAGSAVTFRFEVQAGGAYTLFVRHDGAGLGLAAATPAGPAALDAGTAGPFHAIPLTLTPGTYEVTATAGGGQAVFVDWELLLSSGVGQAARSAPGAILPLASPSPSGGTAGMGTSPAGSVGAAAGATTVPASGALASPAQEAASGPARSLVGGLMGRVTDDPAGLPPVAPSPGVGADLALVSLAGLESALLVGLQPGAGADGRGEAGPARGGPSWFEDLAGNLPGGDDVAAADDRGPTEVQPAALSGLPPIEAPAEEVASLAAVHPGVLVGAVAATMASRRIIKRRRDGSAPALDDRGRPRALRARLDRSLDLT